MNFHIEDEAIDDSTHVIELGGEVDLYTAPEFKERMVELIESGKKQIVVDLSKATFIDSTTLGVLVGGVKRLRPTGRIAGPRLYRREHHEDLRDHRPRPRLPDPLVARGRPVGAVRRGLIPSSAVPRTSPRLAFRGPLAQLAEQETLNLKVEGSIPSRPIGTVSADAPSLVRRPSTHDAADMSP